MNPTPSPTHQEPQDTEAVWPTPWRIGDHRAVAHDANGEIVCYAANGSYGPKILAEIVAKVNSHSALRAACERATHAAEYVVKLVEANDRAGQSANPNERADWIGTCAHVYAAMSFISETRAALALTAHTGEGRG